ncbi:HNH endonuclease [Streptomyces sp. NBC_00124]|uniref:HNH endonuclease n=1 Tax=Streptomyces sp. NBC_00124 TaxID=2975662 RepID=UPI002257CB75|nr:HNH endonuclease [Streptomyces sp. NBC_00124]MCX5365877.1 HNH endonuclease [Streptomyces sp. NBC_00124]
MAVSKRLRYEILRRDRYTCRYCGASAPDAPMRVDHVTPVALGGTDHPSNLVAACEPCNSGKTSSIEGYVDDMQSDAVPPSIEVLVSEAERLWSEAYNSVHASHEITVTQLAEVRSGVRDMRRMGMSADLIRRSATVAGFKGDTFICLTEISDPNWLAVTSEATRVWRSLWFQSTGHVAWPDMQDLLLFECSVEQAINAGLDRMVILRATTLAARVRGVYIEDHLDPSVRERCGL